jgi:hypothetical protein
VNNPNAPRLARWLAQERPVDPALDQEILADPDLAEEAYAALALDAELKEVATEAAPASRRPRWVWPTGLVAAVLALAVILPQFQNREDTLPLRLRSGGDIDGAVGMTPVGELDHFPRTFTWHPASGAEGARYRWELYDSDARRRGVAVVADTVLTRPPLETPPDSVGTWRWFVVKLLPDGREGATGKAVTFQVKAGP